VLLVDDHPDTRELLTEVLNTLGANVTAVGSARHAMEHLTTHGADVVVSDISMPEEDGLSLIRRIRHLPGPVADVPAIALTAFARADDRARAIEAGFQMYLTKPVAPNELQAGLAALTARQESGRDTAPQVNGPLTGVNGPRLVPGRPEPDCSVQRSNDSRRDDSVSLTT
jgi:CheY-like chemotaxis protein